MKREEIDAYIEKNRSLLGKMVYHKKFGWGIVFEAPTLDFRVRFEKEPGWKRFPIYSYNSNYFDLEKTQ